MLPTILKKKWFYSEDYIALGLLIVRIGVGIAFICHGFPKLFMGGAPNLAKGLAAAGIPGGVFAAYLSGMAEFFGGIFLIAGLLFRPTAIVMTINMAVALSFHFRMGHPFLEYSHALESGILFLSLILTGPGEFSLDRVFFGEHEAVEVQPKEYHHGMPHPSKQAA